MFALPFTTIAIDSRTDVELLGTWLQAGWGENMELGPRPLGSLEGPIQASAVRKPLHTVKSIGAQIEGAYFFLLFGSAKKVLAAEQSGT